jgi:hypothetical protein
MQHSPSLTDTPYIPDAASICKAEEYMLAICPTPQKTANFIKQNNNIDIRNTTEKSINKGKLMLRPIKIYCGFKGYLDSTDTW